MTRPFRDRLLPAPVNGGFQMADWWVWCGSVIRAEDGCYHMFASRWPHSLPFFQSYLLRSEIVRAVSATPEGPYEFVEVVLPVRGEAFWDGRMTHNPTIHRHQGRYYLFYIGSTFPGPAPGDHDEVPADNPVSRQSWLNIRTGVAVADRIEGPWTRLDQPFLQPRPDGWDATCITNPAPCIKPDGSTLLVYRSSGPRSRCTLGAATAPDPLGPYQRVSDEPVLQVGGPDDTVEDPFIWWNGHCYEAIMKDIGGTVCGEVHGGVHATSTDGLTWQVADPPQAWSRTVTWDDGSVTTQGSLERPQLLFGDDGQPTHLFAATGDGPGGFRNATRTWNMVIPLAAE